MGGKITNSTVLEKDIEIGPTNELGFNTFFPSVHQPVNENFKIIKHFQTKSRKGVMNVSDSEVKVKREYELVKAERVRKSISPSGKKKVKFCRLSCYGLKGVQNEEWLIEVHIKDTHMDVLDVSAEAED